ncbi:GntR family transcriptional regulator/MocR family aminotransferase [Actinoplanes teichomyceticus]|uniref:GntR family transcriptional regulator/MocR family aminotransferase n=1 Tax=Actinoplanes teichomyceticus TaxID=1867 RepID=A0A561VMU5_ACTTI|nr:GntR family transcriptional regulator/MocR family aminotransferase [Actinoplanes teichomyceticus]
MVFRLDPALPRRRAIESAIRTAITGGVLAPGARLPSSRELAAELGIARNTVIAALDDLIAEGVLEARPRSGVFVSRGVDPVPRTGAAVVEPPPAFDLRPGQPEHGSFPASRWVAATRRAAARAGHAPTSGAGCRELRAQLAAYLSRARGVTATAESIVICAGFRTASTLLATALARHGARSVAIEDPSLFGICGPWWTAGFTVTDLPVDDAGAEVHRLTSGTDAVVLTPSHQFPLGGALSPRRRRLVSDWARATGAYIVEDDYDGEFRFDRRPVPALQRSAPEHVVYAGSTSKTLDPALRLGWLALPHELIGPVVESSETLCGGAPLLNQLALADLIASGEYERHIRRQRREYARRRTLLQHTLGALGLRTCGIPAGLHTLIAVDGLDTGAGALRDRLAERGVAVHELARYTRSHQHRAAIVAGFATPSRAQFRPALDALAGTLRTSGD